MGTRKIPLTPTQGGGMCIPGETLRVADIVVSTTSAVSSWLIRSVTFSSVSHAMVYVGNGDVIEAIPEGVVKRPLLDAVQEARLAVSYRVKGMSDQGARRVLGYLEHQVGKRYDWTGAAGSGVASNAVLCASMPGVCWVSVQGGLNSSNRFFCSELVLKAFEDAGHPLTTRRPSTRSPQEIVKVYGRGNLEYVGHLVA